MGGGFRHKILMHILVHTQFTLTTLLFIFKSSESQDSTGGLEQEKSFIGTLQGI